MAGLEWRYTTPAAGFTDGRIGGQARRIVTDVFQSFESGSIQQMIYQMGTKLLADVPDVQEVHLEANNARGTPSPSRVMPWASSPTRGLHTAVWVTAHAYALTMPTQRDEAPRTHGLLGIGAMPPAGSCLVPRVS